MPDPKKPVSPRPAPLRSRADALRHVIGWSLILGIALTAGVYLTLPAPDLAPVMLPVYATERPLSPRYVPLREGARQDAAPVAEAQAPSGR